MPAIITMPCFVLLVYALRADTVMVCSGGGGVGVVSG